MHRTIASLCIVIGLSVAATADAQRMGTLSGRVSVSDSIPIARARVSVIGTELVTIADPNGTFAFASMPLGAQKLDVRMIGYTPRQIAVDVRPGETLFVRAQLIALDPPALPTVDVVAVFNGPMRGFWERSSHGPGTFLVRDEIERMQPRHVTDVLRRVPGLQVRPVAGFYGENLAVFQRGSRCPVMFFVNGSPLPIAEVAINNYVSSDELMGIEIYSASEMPAQFNSSATGAKCGMVGLWTRSGNLPDKKR